MEDDAWLQIYFPESYVGCAVEVGAYDGISMSPTFGLERRGWRVLCIEPNPALEKPLRENRREIWMGACGAVSGTATLHVHSPNEMAYTTLRRDLQTHPEWHPDPNAPWKEVEVQVRLLDQLLSQFWFSHLDVVAIDTEGTELDVLKGFDIDRWKPRCMIIESWDENSPVVDWMAKHGYTRVDRALVNDRFVRND